MGKCRCIWWSQVLGAGGGGGGKWNVAKGNPVNIMYFFEEQLHDGLE